MTNRIAIGLLVLIALFLLVDYLFLGGNSPVFLGRKFIELIEWLAFWR